MFKLKLGKSIAFTDEGFYKNLQTAQELGFQTMDFDIASSWQDREKEKQYYTHMHDGLKAVKQSGLFLNGVHISFGNYWDFSNPQEAQRLSAIKRTAEVFKTVDKYAPRCYILHGSFEPICDHERNRHIEALVKSLNQLKKLTKTTLCVEILPRSCLLNTSKEAIEIIDSVKDVKICVDVNHFLQEKAEDAILQLGSRVFTLHISDHDYIDEKHWMPQKGSINWNKVLNSLEQIGYDGPFNYELSAPLADIKENYQQLFHQYNLSKTTQKPPSFI